MSVLSLPKYPQIKEAYQEIHKEKSFSYPKKLVYSIPDLKTWTYMHETKKHRVYASILTGTVVSIPLKPMKEEQIKKINGILQNHLSLIQTWDLSKFNSYKPSELTQIGKSMISAFENARPIIAFLEKVGFKHKEGDFSVRLKKGWDTRSIRSLVEHKAWEKITGKGGHDQFTHKITGSHIGFSGHKSEMKQGAVLDVAITLQDVVNVLGSEILCLPQPRYVGSYEDLAKRVSKLPVGSFNGLKAYYSKVLEYSIIRYISRRQ